jgi:hypothetical protein
MNDVVPGCQDFDRCCDMLLKVVAGNWQIVYQHLG